MKQHLIKYNLISLIGGIIVYFIHFYALKLTGIQLPFGLMGIYLFFAITSIIVISGVELLFSVMPNTAGYGFLVGVFLKIGVFMILFLGGSLAELKLTLIHKFSILIPLFFYMSVEAMSVIKRLKHV
jgi:hypothetical protein